MNFAIVCGSKCIQIFRMLQHGFINSHVIGMHCSHLECSPKISQKLGW